MVDRSSPPYFHFTHVAAALSILETGVIEATYHEGFDVECISLMAVDKPPNWAAWQSQYPGQHLHRAQVKFTINTKLEVKSWKRHCRDTETVRQTLKVDPNTGDYLVSVGDIQLSEVDYTVHMEVLGVWVPITKQELINMLEGRNFHFRRRVSGKDRRMLVRGGQVIFVEAFDP